MRRAKRDLLTLCGVLVGWVGAVIWSYHIWEFSPCLGYALLLGIAALVARADVNKIIFWLAIGCRPSNPLAGSTVRLWVDSFRADGKVKRARRLQSLAKRCGVRIPKRRKSVYERLPDFFKIDSTIVAFADLSPVWQEI